MYRKVFLKYLAKQSSSPEIKFSEHIPSSILRLKAKRISRFSHVWLFVTPWPVAHQALLSMKNTGKNTGVGSHSLLQGIFLIKTPDPLFCLPGSL